MPGFIYLSSRWWAFFAITSHTAANTLVCFLVYTRGGFSAAYGGHEGLHASAALDVRARPRPF